MTSNLDTKNSSRGDKARAKKYLVEFLPAMLAYVVVLLLVVVFGDLTSNKPSRIIWALLPIVPLVAVVWAVVRHLHRIDQFQSQLMYQSLSIGFVGAVAAAVTIGFLEIAKVNVPLAGWMIFAAGMLSWVLGNAILLQRKS
ncbi:MAG: hypothetical protein ABI137_03430 [Antricoccus sp.]